MAQRVAMCLAQQIRRPSMDSRQVVIVSSASASWVRTTLRAIDTFGQGRFGAIESLDAPLMIKNDGRRGVDRSRWARRA